MSLFAFTSQAQSQCMSAALPRSRTTHWHACPAIGNFTRTARGPLQTVASTTGVTTPATQRTFPAFMPKEVEDIEETVALDMAARMQRVPVNVPCMAREVKTAFVGPATRPSPLSGVSVARSPASARVAIFAGCPRKYGCFPRKGQKLNTPVINEDISAPFAQASVCCVARSKRFHC